MGRGELDYELITPSARIATATHGGRAKCLQRLLRLELPVPKTVAISFSGAEDVVLIDMAHNLGKPFRVFSLDTGRLHPETYQFLVVSKAF